MTWNGAGAWVIALAIAAGELLAHRLDDLPLARHDFERLGDVLAELGQLANRRSRGRSSAPRSRPARAADVRERVSRRPLAVEGCDHVEGAERSAASSSSVASASDASVTSEGNHELRPFVSKNRLAAPARAAG